VLFRGVLGCTILDSGFNLDSNILAILCVPCALAVKRLQQNSFTAKTQGTQGCARNLMITGNFFPQEKCFPAQYQFPGFSSSAETVMSFHLNATLVLKTAAQLSALPSD
jgi:hypothetical protein